jgi:hypothetical protein
MSPIILTIDEGPSIQCDYVTNCNEDFGEVNGVRREKSDIHPKGEDTVRVQYSNGNTS